MTESRTPEDPGAGSGAVDPTTAPAPATPAPDGADSPTQAWPSLATPVAGASGGSADAPTGSHDPLDDGPIIRPASPYEPADSLPSTRVAAVGDGGTFGGAVTSKRGRPGMRWILAIVGVLIVAGASFAIVSLVGGRPAASTAMGYMPETTFTYSEVRLDLPGDQRPKLASFLKAFPGFSDQSQIEPKLNELLDRLVAAASENKQTWTKDIQPWFGGQMAFGIGLPGTTNTANSMTGLDGSLFAVTISDRAKAIAWLTATVDSASLNQSTYGGADLFIPADAGGAFAIAVNDKVMLAGSASAVKNAVDGGGTSKLVEADDVKAALATLDKDYVLFSVTRIRAYADALVSFAATSQPGVLDQTELDETILAMVPAWQASTARFENDAVVMSTVSPSWSIGYDSTNGPSDLLGHMPAKTIAYAEIHDVGPTLTAILARFRALPEAKPVFDQFDQGISILGGFDAVFGWWGDTAVAVTPLSDGTIGAGLIVKPRDAAAADRLLTTLNGFLALAGGNSGITTRTEDHAGTRVTIVDFSATLTAGGGSLPPGYKAEIAWAANNDVAVVGYGSAFVTAVLDAGPGNSLNDDARFKGLLGRVGAENMGITFVDLAAIRGLLEPLAQAEVSPEMWTHYTTEIQPYLKPLDAIISAIRKDGGLDRGSGAFTAH